MAESGKKSIVFYYQSTAQVVKYYPGTSIPAILGVVLKRFSLADECTIDDLEVLDEDGDPVAFDPAALPNGVKLYVQVSKAPAALDTPPASFPVPVPPGGGAGGCEVEGPVVERPLSKPLFCWDALLNSSIGYTLSNGDLTLREGSGAFVMPVLPSTRSFKAGSGSFRWRVVWSQNVTYQGVGLLSNEEKATVTTVDWGTSFSSMPLFHRTCQTFHFDLETVFELNMDRKELTLRLSGGTTKVFADLPDEVWVGVTLKRNGAGARATLYFD